MNVDLFGSLDLTAGKFGIVKIDDSRYQSDVSGMDFLAVDDVTVSCPQNPTRTDETGCAPYLESIYLNYQLPTCEVILLKKKLI